MKFDFTAIPAGATIKEAKLYLNLIRFSDPGGNCDTLDPSPTSYNTNLYRIINFNVDLSTATGSTYDGVNNWSPSACCFDSFPIGMSDTSVSYDTVDIDTTLGWKSYNAEQLVKDWLSGTPNYGLLIDSDGSKIRDCHREFSSVNNVDSDKHPYLEITYESI
jgi:hypothetical protein